MAGGGDPLAFACARTGRVGAAPAPSPPPLPPPAGRRLDAAGQPQRPLRQGAAARGGAAPRLPAPAAPAASPAPSQPVGGRSAGGPGTWAPPSHPRSHPHTQPHARISCSFPGSRSRARASLAAGPRAATHPHPAQPQGPPEASSRSPLDRSFAASVAAAWTRPFGRCCCCCGTRKEGDAPGGDTGTVMTRSYG